MAFSKNEDFQYGRPKKLLPAHRPTQWDLLAKTLGAAFLPLENKTGREQWKEFKSVQIYSSLSFA